MYCQNCGSQIDEKVDFCPQCGAKAHQNKRLSLDKKKILLIALIIVVIVVVIILLVRIFSDDSTSNEEYKNYGTDSYNEELSYTYSDDGTLKFIDGTFSDITVNSSQDALEALNELKNEVGFNDVFEELELDYQETSEDLTYYRFNQMYEDIPVLNQNVIVSVDNDGNVLSFSGYFVDDIGIDTTPALNLEQVEEIINNNLGENPNIVSNDLYIWDDYDNQYLVYVAIGYSDTKVVQLIIDANSGEILAETSILENAQVYSYTGVGMDDKTYTINLEEEYDYLLLKNRYSFFDSSRNISVTDCRYLDRTGSVLASFITGASPITVDIVDGDIFMAYENEEFIRSAVTAMANYEHIYDYYLDILGRNSFDNKGSKVIINLGVNAKMFSGEDLDNASWLPSPFNQMVIGNYQGKSFAASLDVLAHEFTHGVISYTADFANTPKEEDINKAFESGALNEAYSDILGSLIEGENWTIAENNKILRNAINPASNETPSPSIKNGEYYFPDGFLSEDYTLEDLLRDENVETVADYDNGAIHQNANVVFHAAYLMYESGAFSSKEEMAKVWYNSLFLLSSYSNFEDCALAVIKTAKNMGLSDTAVAKITQAFIDTNMLEDGSYTVSGEVRSGEELLENITVEVYTYYEDEFVISAVTDGDGRYELDLETGIYKVKITNEEFEEFTGALIVRGDTEYNIVLASKGAIPGNVVNMCNTDNCYSLKIYYMEGSGDNDIDEKVDTYILNAGTIFDSESLVNNLNETVGSEMFRTDGVSFYISMAGIEMEVAWYYKDTNTKFDWNKPINSDVEIEMKVLNGLLDNDFFQDINDYFN